MLACNLAHVTEVAFLLAARALGIGRGMPRPAGLLHSISGGARPGLLCLTCTPIANYPCSAPLAWLAWPPGPTARPGALLGLGAGEAERCAAAAIQAPDKPYALRYGEGALDRAGLAVPPLGSLV